MYVRWSYSDILVTGNQIVILHTLKYAGVEMEITFADGDLDRLETDSKFDMGLSPAIVKAYRMRLQMIRSAPDERDFYAMKSLHLEKLKGKKSHQHSMRLNRQMRLVLELEGAGNTKRVKIVAVENYH